MKEISRSAQEAANGTNNVSNSMTSVNQAATDTGNLVQEPHTTSQKLSDQSHSLHEKVKAFILNIRDTSSNQETAE